jgi:hypothetical protein
MKSFKWKYGMQYSPLFGVMYHDAIVQVDSADPGRMAVAEEWVKRGVAEWVEESEPKKPTKGKTIREG